LCFRLGPAKTADLPPTAFHIGWTTGAHCYPNLLGVSLTLPSPWPGTAYKCEPGPHF
jgi:hypothetical protein